MLTVLETRRETSITPADSERTMRGRLRQTLLSDIGYPGDTERAAAIRTDGTYWYWAGDRRGSRTLNWFGRIRDDGAQHITVEVNSPHFGSHGRIAGWY